jgi:hypothetical protein
MSIEYSVSSDGLRIEALPMGVLGIKETGEYFNRLKNDKTVKRGAIEIVNFKFVTDFKISYLEIENITRIYQEPKALQTISATLFVCETQLAYGSRKIL